MRIPKNFSRYTTDPIERFFVELMYSLVHKEAMDSHRVRSMDAVNIIRELQTLLTPRFPSDTQADLKLIAEEAKEILNADAVIQKYFNVYSDELREIIVDLSQKGKSGQFCSPHIMYVIF